MPRTSIKERNKAIRQAWEKEQQLVREGKRTRDWTKEQQQDILDPDKGKAYDDQGRAFEGQHMRSAAEYPEHQGNPDNIQFLTRDEHLEAHKGRWQNPTNWYYDPDTKEFHDFGDGDVIPCKIIELNDPIVVLNSSGKRDKMAVEGDKPSKKEKTHSSTSTTEERISNSQKARTENATVKTTVTPELSGSAEIPKAENGFVKGLKTVGRFIIHHPLESIEITGVVIVGTIKLVSAVGGSHNKGGTLSTPNPAGNGLTNSLKNDITDKVADIIEKATRAENDVSGHKQRYHTKNGVIWKDKAPCHRGGKDS